MKKKLVVVTGASGHLGWAIAQSLLEKEMSVLAVARGEQGLKSLVEQLGKFSSALVTLSFDASTDGLVEEAFEIAKRRGEYLAGWVNNAHTRPSGEPLGTMTRAVTEESVKALSDTLLLVERFAELSAKAQNRVSIVNLASMYGMVSPYPNLYRDYPYLHNPPVYGAVKAGILQFTRYAAVHYAPAGITVNAVSPGPFPRSNHDEGFLRNLSQLVPMARLGAPSDVGEAVSFLLGDGARFITGQNLVVDGGWTVW